MVTLPYRSTIGAQLLTKMGWRHGQGVGARVAKKIHDDNEGLYKQESACNYGMAILTIWRMFVQRKWYTVFTRL